MDNVIYGFCIYVTSYTGHYVYIWTLKKLIDFGINKYEDKKREEKLKKYRIELKKKVLELGDKYDFEILSDAKNQWPYLGRRCPHSLDLKYICGMCVGGCDFY